MLWLASKSPLGNDPLQFIPSELCFGELNELNLYLFNAYYLLGRVFAAKLLENSKFERKIHFKIIKSIKNDLYLLQT